MVVRLDRIRRWAREKAHGRAPSTTEFHKQPSRQATNASGNRSIAPSTHSGTTAGGNNFSSTRDDVATSTLDPSPSALGGGVGGARPKNDYKQKNVAARFGITVKDILLSNYLNVLLVFVPVGIAARFAHLSGGIIFAMNAIAIVPLAGLLSHATESVARRLGDTVGALLNVTFGNAVELIIFIIALVKNGTYLPVIYNCYRSGQLQKLTRALYRDPNCAGLAIGVNIGQSTVNSGHVFSARWPALPRADLQLNRHPDEFLPAESGRHELVAPNCIPCQL